MHDVKKGDDMIRILTALLALSFLSAHDAAAGAPPQTMEDTASATATDCLTTPGAHPVTDYGSFTPNSTAARAKNTATINAALNASGRIICLPAGTYYLGNRSGWSFEATAIGITHNNVTLWGAGKGVTILHTVSAFANHHRGHGIFITGSPSTAQHDITLRDF